MLQPISPESREALDALIKYYTDNAVRMREPEGEEPRRARGGPD